MVCCSTKLGGLGILNLDRFATALLAKMATTLMDGRIKGLDCATIVHIQSILNMEKKAKILSSHHGLTD
jgi:hypothetical protein